MELNQLKVIFDSGALKSAVVTVEVLGKGYNLMFEGKDGKKYMMTKQRSDSHEPRPFKTIDAAVGNASKIGFKNIRVQL